MAESLPPGGRIITVRLQREARRAGAGEHRGDPVRRPDRDQGRPALESIASLDGPFDMVFIDADKVGYLAYYEALLPKLAPNGVILVDNVLWSGRLLDRHPTTRRRRRPCAVQRPRGG
jgi:caffeoyl-CoA O-methyltransferase